MNARKTFFHFPRPAMSLLLTFLNTSEQLTKTFELQKTGEITKSTYPNSFEFTSLKESAKDMKEFATLLQAHASLGHCLLKGHTNRQLNKESRAGTTDANATTEIICLDIDGSQAFKTPDEVMKALSLQHVSYVVQYSASHMIGSTALRCHIFFRIDKPLAAPQIKQHLLKWNLSIPEFANELSLTKTQNTLSYTLDITACQNDKLIYIAPPVLVGIKDPLKNRILFIKGKHECATLPPPPSIVVNKAEVEVRIASLRDAAKLPKRKNVYKHVNNTEILSKPDEAGISEIKEERGFVYFNLNGGNSWGYYHPVNNPDFIFNFKGEPTYLTKELLPEYWEQITKQIRTNPNATTSAPKANAIGVVHLAFLDKRSSGYWRGTFKPSSNELDIYPAKNETQIKHFAAANNFTIGDFIPEWDISFNPNDNVRVDLANRSINLFTPTSYMLATPKTVKKIPPTIGKVIFHVVGSDQAAYDHMLNWIAFIVQFRKPTKTAWLTQGIPGTGKGVLMNDILRPLLGFNQTTVRRMEELNEHYNSYLENCLLCMVDEVQTSALKSESSVMAKLKNFITEAKITIRGMYQTSYEVNNHCNWIFASNMPDPILISKEDRRYNVGKYQATKIIISKQEVEVDIPKELQAFNDYLMGITVDLDKANTPLQSQDRDDIIAISETSIDTVAHALIHGDFEFFMDQLPTMQIRTNIDRDSLDDYRSVLNHLLVRTDPTTGLCKLSRDELHVLFDYTVGDMPVSPNKFTSRLKHHRIRISRVRIDHPVQGFSTVWKNLKEFPNHIKTLNDKPKLMLVKQSKSNLQGKKS